MLRPSRIHSALLILVHLVALLAVLLSHIWSVAQASVLVMAITTSGIYRVYRFGLLRHPASVLGINYDRGNWRLSLRSGEVLDAALLSPIVTSRWFIVLNFQTGHPGLVSRLFSRSGSRLFSRSGSRLFTRSGSRLFSRSGSRLSVVIANDSLDRDTQRRCQVFFRFALSG